jgi:hypothetical protein
MRSMITSRSLQMFLSLFVAVTVWICHADGLLSRPEALLYRWGLGLIHLGQPPSSPLLLVEVSSTQLRRQEATMLPRLLGTLEQLGAQAVVFNFLPISVSPAFYQEAVRYGNVFFGRGSSSNNRARKAIKRLTCEPARRTLDTTGDPLARSPHGDDGVRPAWDSS